MEAQILSSVGHAIVAADLAGNLIYWNEAAEALYGWPAEEVLGRNARDVGAPTSSEAEARDIISLIRKGQTWTGQMSLQRRDGSRFKGAVVCSPLRDGAGELIGVASSIRDVTERADAEAIIRQSAGSLAEAQRIAKLGSWDLDIATGDLHWSDQLFDMFGLPRAEFGPSYEAFVERVHPEDRALMDRETSAAVAGERPLELEHRIVLPDGMVKMIHVKGDLTRGENGQPWRLAGTVLDITERWHETEALRASEERFRSLVSTTAAVVWRTDAAGESTHTSPSWSEFTGLSQDQMGERHWWFSAVHPDDRARAAENWRKAAERGTNYYDEYRLPRHDGVWRNMIVRGTALRDSDGTIREWIGTCVDVTGLRQADEAARFQARVLDATGESIIATDPAGKIIYLNHFAEKQWGWSAAEAMGRDVMEVTVPVASRRQAEEIMEALRHGETWSGEFSAHRRDGSTFPIEATNTPLFSAAGDLVAIIGISRDISERHETEQDLRASEERYRAAFDQAAVGVCQMAFDGTFERVNPRLCELLGFSAEELMKLNFSDITHPDDLPQSMRLLAELSEQQRQFFAIEKRYIHKDGQAIWALSTVSLMRYGEGKPQSLLAIVEDISAQKEAELDLRQSEADLRALTVRLNAAREEEAKRIARELHDELGQALTAITIETADAQRQLAAADGTLATEEIQRRLASVRVLLEQAIGTTRRVCTELRPALLDQVGLIPALEWQARDFEARSGIFCSLSLPEPAPDITGEVATAVYRILQEILTNVARHSNAREVTVDLTSSAEEIRLTVDDNGRGMSNALAEKRSGLGLIGIRERTLAVGGSVRFEGANGNGTRISIVVPQQVLPAENG